GLRCERTWRVASLSPSCFTHCKLLHHGAVLDRESLLRVTMWCKETILTWLPEVSDMSIL
ncbi:hypothetical protein FOCC_FOCC005783, partial [Frankliniella occidentalis]